MPTPPSARPTSALVDARPDTRLVLSALWTSMLFVFAYVDIFGFWRTDVIQGALDGEVPGVGFSIGQPFLALTTLYVLIPSLMVVGSLVLPARVARTANLTLAPTYALSIALSMVGEHWVYYLLGSAAELVLLAGIARSAWTWPSA